MTYTIKAVSPETRPYSSKFGEMISYKVMFNETAGAVEISQKATTPAPKAGDTLEGTIDTSGQYGPKFKKEYNQGGGFGGGNPKPAYGQKTEEQQESIARSVALKAAVDATDNHHTDEILATAELFLAWLQAKEPSQESLPVDTVAEMPADFLLPEKTALDDIFDAPLGEPENPWKSS